MRLVVEGYSASGGVEQAIKAAAKLASKQDPSLSVHERMRQEVFRRFLSRVFAGTGTQWLLKGGTGMLARVPNTRTTLDIDLYRSGNSLQRALQELRELAGTDLGDHFRFVFRMQEATLAGDQQSHAEGIRAIFDVFLGVKKFDVVKIDLVAGVLVTGAVTVQEPAAALELPRLFSSPYRLYPVVDQIADKVCATLAKYASGSSTRVKDLIDLVVLAKTQRIDAASLLRAIRAEAALRRLPKIERFIVPEGWGPQYARIARTTAACAGYGSLDAALELMDRFLGELLRGERSISTWDPDACEWIQ